MYTNIIYIILNYKYTPRIEVVYTNYFVSSLNIYIGKTLVPNFNTSGFFFGGWLLRFIAVCGEPYDRGGCI